MLQLDENITIGEGDKISLKCGNQILKGVVLNSGEGTSTPEDDEFYWLHAPSKGVNYPNSVGIRTNFFLVRINTTDIPFAKLPEKLMVQKENNERYFNFMVTAIIGLNENEMGCMLYLELKR